jgi:hypothetical protein
MTSPLFHITNPGSDPVPPRSPLKIIVVAPEKIMVVQVLLSLRCWAQATCTAVCARGSRHIQRSVLVDRYLDIAFDGSDDRRFIDFVNDLEQQSPGQVVMAADTAGSRLVNRVRAHLHADCAIGPTDSMLDVLDDKWRFHHLCNQLALPTPETLYVESKHEINFDSAGQTLGLPFFVKPVNSAQSRGAYAISSREEFCHLILHDPGYDYGPLLLQRLVRGTDVCVSIFSVQGQLRAIATQRRKPPYQVDSPIEFFHLPKFERMVQKICEATGYEGLMHIDARLEADTGQLWLFEANPRYWRSMSAATWAGLNFVAEHLSSSPFCTRLRRLSHGSADVFHHPLVRPWLWHQIVSGGKTRRRMLGLMAVEICTLTNSLRKMIKGQ